MQTQMVTRKRRFHFNITENVNDFDDTAPSTSKRLVTNSSIENGMSIPRTSKPSQPLAISDEDKRAFAAKFRAAYPHAFKDANSTSGSSSDDICSVSAVAELMNDDYPNIPLLQLISETILHELNTNVFWILHMGGLINYSEALTILDVNELLDYLFIVLCDDSASNLHKSTAAGIVLHLFEIASPLFTKSGAENPTNSSSFPTSSSSSSNSTSSSSSFTTSPSSSIVTQLVTPEKCKDILDELVMPLSGNLHRFSHTDLHRILESLSHVGSQTSNKGELQRIDPPEIECDNVRALTTISDILTRSHNRESVIEWECSQLVRVMRCMFNLPSTRSPCHCGNRRIDGRGSDGERDGICYSIADLVRKFSRPRKHNHPANLPTTPSLSSNSPLHCALSRELFASSSPSSFEITSLDPSFINFLTSRSSSLCTPAISIILKECALLDSSKLTPLQPPHLLGIQPHSNSDFCKEDTSNTVLDGNNDMVSTSLTHSMTLLALHVARESVTLASHALLSRSLCLCEKISLASMHYIPLVGAMSGDIPIGGTNGQVKEGGTGVSISTDVRATQAVLWAWIDCLLGPKDSKNANPSTGPIPTSSFPFIYNLPDPFASRSMHPHAQNNSATSVTTPSSVSTLKSTPTLSPVQSGADLSFVLLAILSFISNTSHTIEFLHILQRGGRERRAGGGHADNSNRITETVDTFIQQIGGLINRLKTSTASSSSSSSTSSSSSSSSSSSTFTSSLVELSIERVKNWIATHKRHGRIPPQLIQLRASSNVSARDILNAFSTVLSSTSSSNDQVDTVLRKDLFNLVTDMAPSLIPMTLAKEWMDGWRECGKDGGREGGMSGLGIDGFLVREGLPLNSPTHMHMKSVVSNLMKIAERITGPDESKGPNAKDVARQNGREGGREGGRALIKQSLDNVKTAFQAALASTQTSYTTSPSTMPQLKIASIATSSILHILKLIDSHYLSPTHPSNHPLSSIYKTSTSQSTSHTSSSSTSSDMSLIELFEISKTLSEVMAQSDLILDCLVSFVSKEGRFHEGATLTPSDSNTIRSMTTPGEGLIGNGMKGVALGVFFASVGEDVLASFYTLLVENISMSCTGQQRPHTLLHTNFAGNILLYGILHSALCWSIKSSLIDLSSSFSTSLSSSNLLNKAIVSIREKRPLLCSLFLKFHFLLPSLHSSYHHAHFNQMAHAMTSPHLPQVPSNSTSTILSQHELEGVFKFLSLIKSDSINTTRARKQHHYSEARGEIKDISAFWDGECVWGLLGNDGSVGSVAGDRTLTGIFRAVSLCTSPSPVTTLSSTGTQPQPQPQSQEREIHRSVERVYNLIIEEGIRIVEKYELMINASIAAEGNDATLLAMVSGNPLERDESNPTPPPVRLPSSALDRILSLVRVIVSHSKILSSVSSLSIVLPNTHSCILSHPSTVMSEVSMYVAAQWLLTCARQDNHVVVANNIKSHIPPAPTSGLSSLSTSNSNIRKWTNWLLSPSLILTLPPSYTHSLASYVASLSLSFSSPLSNISSSLLESYAWEVRHDYADSQQGDDDDDDAKQTGRGKGNHMAVVIACQVIGGFATFVWPSNAPGDVTMKTGEFHGIGEDKDSCCWELDILSLMECTYRDHVSITIPLLCAKPTPEVLSIQVSQSILFRGMREGHRLVYILARSIGWSIVSIVGIWAGEDEILNGKKGNLKEDNAVDMILAFLNAVTTNEMGRSSDGRFSLSITLATSILSCAILCTYSLQIRSGGSSLQNKNKAHAQALQQKEDWLGRLIVSVIFNMKELVRDGLNHLPQSSSSTCNNRLSHPSSFIVDAVKAELQLFYPDSIVSPCVDVLRAVPTIL